MRGVVSQFPPVGPHSGIGIVQGLGVKEEGGGK